VLVMGAGAIGCWLGGCLQSAGASVHFVGRPRVLQGLAEQGLTLTDLDGGRRSLPAAALRFGEQVPAGLAPALVLLAVKSAATAEAARALAAVLAPGTLVLSMQNGVGNAGVAQSAAPLLRVLPGMVPFNVVEPAPGHFHRGTTGQVAAQDDPALRAWQPLWAAAGLPLRLQADMAPVQWGKLLLNLNNAVNALSGLPLRAQLLRRSYRLCTALLISEALLALKQAGIRPARLSPLPAAALPTVLRLSTPLFKLVAARTLRIDEQARSSMALDLQHGRPTEVDELCGAVAELAATHGLQAPANRRMQALVKAWPAQPRAWGGSELLAALRGA
jgi:2-dehydropantoate 2-reductase